MQRHLFERTALLEVLAQRRLTKHMFAGCQRRTHSFCMVARMAADIDTPDLSPLQQGGQQIAGMHDAMSIGKTTRTAGIVAEQGGHIGAGHVARTQRWRLPPDGFDHLVFGDLAGPSHQKTDRAIVDRTHRQLRRRNVNHSLPQRSADRSIQGLRRCKNARPGGQPHLDSD